MFPTITAREWRESFAMTNGRKNLLAEQARRMAEKHIKQKLLTLISQRK